MQYKYNNATKKISSIGAAVAMSSLILMACGDTQPAAGHSAAGEAPAPEATLVAHLAEASERSSLRAKSSPAARGPVQNPRAAEIAPDLVGRTFRLDDPASVGDLSAIPRSLGMPGGFESRGTMFLRDDEGTVRGTVNEFRAPNDGATVITTGLINPAELRNDVPTMVLVTASESLKLNGSLKLSLHHAGCSANGVWGQQDVLAVVDTEAESTYITDRGPAVSAIQAWRVAPDGMLGIDAASVQCALVGGGHADRQP